MKYKNNVQKFTAINQSKASRNSIHFYEILKQNIEIIIYKNMVIFVLYCHVSTHYESNFGKALIMTAIDLQTNFLF